MDPPDAWIGTGHGKEEVTRMTVLVGNKPYELQEGMTISGKMITIGWRARKTTP